MTADRHDLLPKDAVSAGVLMVTTMTPLAVEGILRALTHVGAPTWRPVADVVVDAVNRLRESGLLTDAPPRDGGDERLMPTAWARA